MKLLLLLTLATISLCSIACSKKNTLSTGDVPEVVVSSFNNQYAGASKVKWKTDEEAGQIVYEAEFKLNKEEMEASYSENGTWIETETEIKVKDLPEAVKTAIANSFSGFEVDEAGSVQRADDSLVYEVELENEATDEEIEVTFSATGSVLSRETEEDDNEDD